MANKLQEWTRHHRVGILIAAALLALGALAAVAVVVFWWKPWADGQEGATVPILVSTSSTSGSGAEVIIVSEVGGAVAESGDGQLPIRLSEGQPALQEVAFLQPTTGEPLSEDEITAILARLPAFAAEEGDEAELLLPEDLLPPPRPGETVEEPFPPPEAPVVPEPVEAGPLEVLRFGPSGEIPLAPFLNVTFNQPMVPLATLDALAAEEVPVQLEPALHRHVAVVGHQDADL
jgi:hypothetical protein